MERYHRNYRRGRSGMGGGIFLFIILFALATGYAGTKYIVYPYFLGTSPMEKTNEQTDETNQGGDVTSTPGIILDQQDIKDVEGSKEGTGAADKETGADKETAAVQETGQPESTTSNIATSKGPFTVQFGSFATKEGAEAFASELSTMGIYAYIYESEGNHKLLGLPYAEKAKAQEAVSIVSAQVPDVFVVDMSTLIK